MVPAESISHIQSAGCAGQSDAVTAAHNKCIRGLMSDIQVNGRKKSHLTFLTMEEEPSTRWGKNAILSSSREQGTADTRMRNEQGR